MIGGANHWSELLDQVVDGLGVKQLLLGLHDPGQALVTGHGMVLGCFADPCTHPVCLKNPKLKAVPIFAITVE